MYVYLNGIKEWTEFPAEHMREGHVRRDAILRQRQPRQRRVLFSVQGLRERILH